jgi:cytidine deaminase
LAMARSIDFWPKPCAARIGIRRRRALIQATIGAGPALSSKGVAPLTADAPPLAEIVSRLGTAAKNVARHAHAPYSNFHVGAAVLSSDGRIFVGCNVENVSFPEGICAETAAIAAMVAGGEKYISHLALWSAGPDICTPCGGCRQRMAELGAPMTPIDIFTDDQLTLSTTLGALLPSSFGTSSVAAHRAQHQDGAHPHPSGQEAL